MMPPPSCWVVTDGTVGMVNQAHGFAEAMGLQPVLKTFRARGPWTYLSPSLWLASHHAATPDSDSLDPPWPELIVSCGWQSVAPVLRIRRESAGRTRAIHVQDPKVDPSRFDLVVAPLHDRLSGPNVLPVRGAVNRITPRRLAEGVAAFAGTFDHIPHPRVAVMIGGDNAVFRLRAATVAKLADDLAGLCRLDGAGLMVSTSRRTGPEAEATLLERLRDLPAVVWTGQGENPYLAFLGLADALIVTADSVNMISESLATGKPVHVVALEGGSAKFARFHDDLRAHGYSRMFAGRLEAWTYEPLDDTRRAAAEARRRLDL